MPIEADLVTTNHCGAVLADQLIPQGLFEDDADYTITDEDGDVLVKFSP